MTTPRISLALGPWNDTTIHPVSDWSAGSLVLSLTEGPQVSFTLPGGSSAAQQVSGLATDVYVSKLGLPWQRLRVLPVAQDWGESGEDVVTLTAVGYKRVVAARNIFASPPPTYSGVDQGAILWDLIQDTQALPGGDLGITAGTYLTGQLRDRTEYRTGDNYGTLFTDMGNVEDGCWWGIDGDLVFEARLWDAFPVRDLPIVRGQNARRLNRAPAALFANVGGAIGSTEHTTAHWEEDPSVTTDPRGRWEVFDASHSSVILQATVVDYALGLVADGLHPPAVWTVELDPADYFEGASDYDPGDFVTINVPASAVNDVAAPPVSVSAQVTEVSIDFDESGATVVKLAALEVTA